MSDGLEATKTFRAKVQRSPNGAKLGACLMIGADDLAFVEPGTEWLTIKKIRTESGLIIEIGGEPQ